MKSKIIHKEMSKIGFKKVYACNQAILADSNKTAIYDKEITCKNCRRIVGKLTGNIWEQKYTD